MPEKRENRKGWKRDGRRWEATEKEGCRVCIAEPDAGTKRGEPMYRCIVAVFLSLYFSMLHKCLSRVFPK